MRREQIADLAGFVAVAEEKSFTRAAAKLGLSQSALSQIVRRLEDQLGLLLLSRTTRSVAPTEAGERLLQTMAPMLHDLDRRIETLSEFHDKPHGSFRITTVEHAAKTILVPALTKLLLKHPEINVEVVIDYGLVDIVAERYDAGVRLGEAVAKDMIAVRISPDIPMAIVGSPDYFRRHPAPRDSRQLAEHRGVNLRLPTSGVLNAWRLVQANRDIRVHVDGTLTFNTIDLILDAVLAGVGLGYLPLDQVSGHLKRGQLVRVLKEATPPLPGYHLYYPNRRHASLAFKMLVDAWRYRAPSAGRRKAEKSGA